MAREKDRAKFKALAEKRVTKALNCIRLIGNLSNRSNYVYSEADAQKICRALRAAVEEVRIRFDRSGVSSRDKFSL